MDSTPAHGFLTASKSPVVLLRMPNLTSKDKENEKPIPLLKVNLSGMAKKKEPMLFRLPKEYYSPQVRYTETKTKPTTAADYPTVPRLIDIRSVLMPTTSQNKQAASARRSSHQQQVGTSCCFQC